MRTTRSSAAASTSSRTASATPTSRPARPALPSSGSASAGRRTWRGWFSTSSTRTASSCATRRTGILTERSRPRIGVVSCYFPLFDAQMPPGFRQEREAVARGYAERLTRDFEVVDAFLAADADGDLANATLRDAD